MLRSQYASATKQNCKRTLAEAVWNAFSVAGEARVPWLPVGHICLPFRPKAHNIPSRCAADIIFNRGQATSGDYDLEISKARNSSCKTKSDEML
jgi:hypothetical protein